MMTTVVIGPISHIIGLVRYICCYEFINYPSKRKLKCPRSAIVDNQVPRRKRFPDDPAEEVWAAHLEAKRALVNHVNRETNIGMDFNAFTLVFARRAAAYKRADLLFSDPARLLEIFSAAGPFQIIYAGKAHPKDEAGKELIKRIFAAIESLRSRIKAVYLENYNLELGTLLTAGADVWLNTPRPPFEASGTSGMKAALNGVPSLSVLDGWWIEGCIEGITGWAIGPKDRGPGEAEDDSKDAASLHEKLESVVLPLFYQNRDGFIDVMRHAIALNGSFFNTHRMLQQYIAKGISEYVQFYF